MKITVFDREGFAEAMRRRRAEKGLSQADAAKEIGIGQATVHRAESGYGIPTADNYGRMCAWLGVPADTYLNVAVPEAA